MLNLQKLVIDRFVEELEYAYRQSYGDRMPLLGRTAAWCGKLALENIANSDALYHNLDHTVMVTMVGQAILQGKHLCEGGVSPQEWLHFTIALLCHDIGLVRGVCRQDNGHVIATGVNGETVSMRAGATDASLSVYHVDRSKLFVRERFNQPLFIEIDIDQICEYIEITRFPIPSEPEYQITDNYAGLVRAADFIGQLGDPNYLRKLPALFHELEEVEAGGKIAYESLEDMRNNYARFYWDVVNPYIQDALRYLRVTQEGKQWIANLHSHVFDIEHTYRGNVVRS
ncbi:metal-dependent phosphohydrolase [bacterium]|nr:metal-dependent phosphohydrolase [bacterium]